MQLDNAPDVGVPNTGVTITILVEVQADMTPADGVPNAGVTKVGDKLVYVFIADNTTDLDTAVLSLSVINIWSVPTTGDLAV